MVRSLPCDRSVTLSIAPLARTPNESWPHSYQHMQDGPSHYPPISVWAPVIGVVLGTGLAAFFGLYDLDRIAAASWFGLPDISIPGFDLEFGPDFWALLPAFLLTAVIGSIRAISSSTALQRISWHLQRPVDLRAVQGTVTVDGMSNLLCGVAGTVPNTTYSLAAPLVEITGVAARGVAIATGAVFLALAFLPKALALVLEIPGPVVGAYLLVLVALLFMIGIGAAMQDGMDTPNVRPVPMSWGGATLSGTIRDAVRALFVIRQEFQNVVEEDFGGRKVRFIGDCIHAVIAEGSSVETDDRRSVSTAAMCAGGLHSSFVLCKIMLGNLDSLGLAVGLELGQTPISRIGIRGERSVRLASSIATTRSEQMQRDCEENGIKPGPSALDVAPAALEGMLDETGYNADPEYGEIAVCLSAVPASVASPTHARAHAPTIVSQPRAHLKHK